MTPRTRRILRWSAGLVVGLPVGLVGVSVAALLVAGNIDPGRRLIAHIADRATGGTVRLAGLHGRFPDRLRLDHLELRDPQGTYLDVDQIVLDWSPLALARLTARIDRLEIGHVALARLPQASTSASAPTATSSSSSGTFSLPVRVVAPQVAIHTIDIGPAVAGAALTLGLSAQADIATLDQGDAALAVQRLDGEGQVLAALSMTPRAITAQLDAHEPANGPLAMLAGLSLDGPLKASATLAGPRQAEALHLNADAGPLHVLAQGTLNEPAQSGAVDLHITAPAMTPRPDLSWRGIVADVHVQGTATHPDANGQARITDLYLGGASLAELNLHISGNQGQVGTHMTMTGLRVPGAAPDALAAHPLEFQADARLDAPDHPLTFSLTHPAMNVRGHASLGTDLAAQVEADLADLRPLAAIGGADVQGHAHVQTQMATQGQATNLSVDGTIGITGGMAPLPGLIGPQAKLAARMSMNGSDIRVDQLALDGKTLAVSAKGTDTNNALNLDWHVALSDLSVLAATLKGALKVDGQITGPQTDLGVNADLSGQIGAQGLAPGPLTATLRSAHLPGQPDVTLKMDGQIDRAPLEVDLALQRGADHAFTAHLNRISWKTTQIQGQARLAPGAFLPNGKVEARIERLADFTPFIGQPVGGSLNALLDTQGETARLTLNASNLSAPAAQLERLEVQARTEGVTDKARIDARIRVTGAQAGPLGAAGQVEIVGPRTALAVRLNATVQPQRVQAPDQAVRLNAAATVDVPGQRVTLTALTTDGYGPAVRLQGPARVDFGKQIQVDRLRVASGSALLDVAGKISPELDLTASLHGVTPELAKPFAPGLNAQGTLSADARLRGTPTAPTGTVTVAATDLRQSTGPASGLPPASLHARADLRGTSAQVDAQLRAGTATHLDVTGQVPLQPTGALHMRATGGMDLAMLDPILTASGRRVRGQVEVNLGLEGTASSPRAAGTVRLVKGEVQDFAQGVHLMDLDATIEAQGDRVRITQFQGKAGAGTISASGEVGILEPRLPLDLTLKAHNARPLASDRLTADLDADVHVHGAVQGAMAVGGTINLTRASINLPDRLPASVAVLDVRRPGEAPPPPPDASQDIALDVTMSTPLEAIFVRGHGLDAVLGGKLHLGGTSSAPQVDGGFEMRHGTFSLAGTTLNFTKGKVSFAGQSITGKIDPSLDFEADSIASGIIAKLLVTGYASNPKIALDSEPTLPQDEILAHLLFGTGTQQLGPLQIASIAQALATITGLDGGGPSVLDRVRTGLGLDRLSIGSSGGNSISNSIPNLDQKRGVTQDAAPTIQAGRYVADGIYVGAKQGTSGSDTQAQVQVDLTRRLKLETDLGSGRGANNVGLRYQFEY